MANSNIRRPSSKFYRAAWAASAGLGVLGLAANARALTLNFSYDTATSNAFDFAGIQSAMNYVGGFFSALYTDPITVNITVSGTLTSGGAEGGANSFSTFNYGSFTSEMAFHSTTAVDTAAVANLPAVNPGGATVDILNGEAKALGLIGANQAGEDGVFLFNNTPSDVTYTFDPNNRAVAGEIDFIGMAEHEVSHALGRIGEVTSTPGSYLPYDYMRYDSPGVLSSSSSDANAYFSFDGGNTKERYFSGVSDPYDWADATGNNDSCTWHIGYDQQDYFTPVDVSVLDALGYTPVTSARTLTWYGNTGPGRLDSNQWRSVGGKLIPTYIGASLSIANGGQVYYEPTSRELLGVTLSSSSIFGQSLSITNGSFVLNNLNDTSDSHPLILNSGGSLSVSGATSTLTVNGPLSIADAAGSTASATFNGTVIIGANSPPDPSLYVGNYGNGTVTQSGGSVYVNNAVNIAAQPNSTGTYNMNGGTLTVVNAIVDGGIGAVAGGTGNFNLTAGTVTAGGLTVFQGSSYTQSGGTATFGHLTGNGQVSINGGITHLAANSGLATIGALSISFGAGFDLSNNHLIITYGSGPDPIASIALYLKVGYNGGGGIYTSAPQVVGGLSYGIGYADSADPGNPAGLSSGTIEVKYTLLGDADLNGIVNGIDFGILAGNFNKGVTGWDQGDFNYDNIVNGIDFGFLAANFNKGASGASVGAPAWADPAIVAFAAANGLMADVPEPTAIGSLAVAALLAQRRRKSR